MDGCIFVECEVRARRIVIVGIGIQEMAKMCFAKHKHVVNTFSPDRSD